MKLSIVILCWNDREVIGNCLRSIFANTHSSDFEVIVCDNGSTDGLVEIIRKHYPKVCVIENKSNLRFAKGNNVGIRASRGEYVLILNPDTIIHDGTLDKMVEFADQHPETGAFGCRVVNSDGSYQESGRPFPSLRGRWIATLQLRSLGYFSDWFLSDTYVGWKGDTPRQVDWLAGCFILLRTDLLQRLGGFDEQFFYYYEDVDLCYRVWQTGYSIIFTPHVTITHLGGQSTKRSPLTFELDSYVTRYRYYYKYGGKQRTLACRRAELARLMSRRLCCGFLQLLKRNKTREKQLHNDRVAFEWNLRVDPVRLVEHGEEPQLPTRPAAQIPEI